MKSRKKFFRLITCFLLCVIFAGCGERGGQFSRTGEMIQPEQRVQWETQGFVVTDEPERDSKLNILQYTQWEHSAAFDADGGEVMRQKAFGSCGELIWWLSEVTDKEKHREWVLEIYDAFTEECTVKRFSLEQLGLEENGGWLRGMDMIDRDNYVFWWVEAETDDEGISIRRTADRRIYTNLAGEVHSVDLWPVCLEKGLEEESGTGDSLGEGNCDGKGNAYVLASRGKYGYSSVHFFDRDGNMILEYRGDQYRTVREPLRTREGELIFPVWDMQNKQMEYLWADTEECEMRSLAKEGESANDIYQIYGMQGNHIYYNKSNKEIIRWNIESGERTKVLDLSENGLTAGLKIGLALGKEGEYPVLYFRDQDNEKDWMAPLTDREVERETIRIAELGKNIINPKSGVAESVSIVCNVNRGMTYVYEDCRSEEARTRVLADLSSGKGPDLMYVSLEDMRMLAEKGALLDIRELISEELMEEILPGALGLGTVEGKLMGLPLAVNAETLMIDRDVWGKESWTLEDVLGLMESGDLEGGIYHYTSYFEPPATVLLLIEYALGDSFLIDWEDRECHFDDERFIRLLEVTRTSMNSKPVETDTRLNDGKRTAYERVGDQTMVGQFDVARERENGNYVGFPTNSGCGNYLTAEGVIVVNVNAKSKEAVRAYLEVVCSSKIQQATYAVGVCGIDSSRVYTDWNTGKLMFNREELGVFEDGTTSVDRINVFLRSCVAAPPRYSFLEDIIREELLIMWEQNREPEDVAKMINNRVQLYLDEGE